MITKTMKTLTVLIIAGTAFVACSCDDIIEQPTESKTYTMTVRATKGGEEAITRGLSLDGKTLNVKWYEGEVVDVVQIDQSTHKRVLRGTLTSAASIDGSTTLTGTVCDVDEEVQLEFYLHGYNRDYTG